MFMVSYVLLIWALVGSQSMIWNPCGFHMIVNMNFLFWMSVLVFVATSSLATALFDEGEVERKTRTHRPSPDVSNRLFSSLLDRPSLVPSILCALLPIHPSKTVRVESQGSIKLAKDDDRNGMNMRWRKDCHLACAFADRHGNRHLLLLNTWLRLDHNRIRSTRTHPFIAERLLDRACLYKAPQCTSSDGGRIHSSIGSPRLLFLCIRRNRRSS
jgi:hypothetical protein